MLHRRTLAALIALTGFTAYFAESLVAVACMPGGDAHAVVAEAPDAGEHSGHNTHRSAPSAPSAPSDAGGDRTGSCPLGMPAGASSCVALALPGATEPVRAPGVADTSGYLAPHVRPGLLFAVDLFHPPRA